MKLVLVLCAAATTCLAFRTISPPQRVANIAPGELNLTQLAGANLNVAMVRMDYSDWAGNHDHTDTTCHIVNASLNYIRLDNIYILGDGGIERVLAVSPKFRGKILPPMGHVQFLVNSSIPGVTPQRSRNMPSIAQHVVVTWSGSASALRLTSVIRRIAPGNNDNRTVYQVEGKILTP